jgi:hypothetical protein
VELRGHCSEIGILLEQSLLVGGEGPCCYLYFGGAEGGGFGDELFHVV